MSAEKPRRYVDYRSVTLLANVTAPHKGTSESAFSSDHYRFFLEGPMLGLECKKTGAVLHVPITGIRVAQVATAPKERPEPKEPTP